MAFHVHISPADALGVVTFLDAVTGADLAGALDALYADPRWRPGFDALWDFGRMSTLVLDPDDLKALVALDFAYEAVGGVGRDAIVVTTDLDRSLAALFEHLSKETPRPNRVFASVEAARTWLAAPAG